ncbi:hypothetical protein B0T10DRAFT_534355 [Thelonectria olida]|uniref:Uncharacterized protein n=1 Tax=Thelonectria olida TaxID=1576542 RepID=A0A9P8VND3_9HYPO|nr:hypothetical protein B0T10DRAFT_534355 [Thelonectria olida]
MEIPYLRLIVFAKIKEVYNKACYFTRQYCNFSIRITLGIEASNNNIKSYLFNIKERDFIHAYTKDKVLTFYNYIGLSLEYLGKLRIVILVKALGLIIKQYRLVRKVILIGKNPNPSPLGAYNNNYSIVTFLHGRPKNTTQAMLVRLAIKASSQPGGPTSSQPDRTSGRKRGQLPGSRNKLILARLT